jgi:hypothetical protein
MPAKTARPVRWTATATVTYWDRACGDYVEIDLDHDSTSETAEEAEDEAREAWGDHGYSPEKVTVRPFEWLDD